MAVEPTKEDDPEEPFGSRGDTEIGPGVSFLRKEVEPGIDGTVLTTRALFGDGSGRVRLSRPLEVRIPAYLTVLILAAGLLAVYAWADRPDASDAGQSTLSGRLVDLFGPAWARPAGVLLFAFLTVLLSVFWVRYLGWLKRRERMRREMRHANGGRLPIEASDLVYLGAEVTLFALAALYVWWVRPGAADAGKHTLGGWLVDTFGAVWARSAGVVLFLAIALLFGAAFLQKSTARRGR